jgi:hypothetical protein
LAGKELFVTKKPRVRIITGNTKTRSGGLDEATTSPEAVALMEFTSDIKVKNQINDLSYITSKGAYIWAGVSVFIAKNMELSKQRLEDITIHTAIYSSVNELYTKAEELIKHEQPETNYVLPTMKLITPPPSQPVAGPYQYERSAVAYKSDDALCATLINNILNKLGNEISESTRVSHINAYIKSGYDELLERSWIIDPIIETTLGLAILSLVPFSFVSRTKKGQLEYRKIQAAAWKYELSRKKGDVQINLTFEAVRIAKALKVGIIAAYQQATSSEGDEPDDLLPGASA